MAVMLEIGDVCGRSLTGRQQAALSPANIH